MKHLQSLFEAAIQHKGFALVNVLQPLRHLQQGADVRLVAGNLVNLDEREEYDPTDRAAASRS